jgi:hypothetical protein
MELSPSWETNTWSATQEIPSVLWTLQDHYCVHNSPPMLTVLSHTNPIQSKVRLNIIFSSTSRTSYCPLPLRFSYQSCPSHTPWLYYSNYIWRIVQVMKILIMQSSPTSHYFIPLWSKYSPQNQVSHSHKITGNIMGLYILTFTFLASRREDKILLNWIVTKR